MSLEYWSVPFMDVTHGRRGNKIDLLSHGAVLRKNYANSVTVTRQATTFRASRIIALTRSIGGKTSRYTRRHNGVKLGMIEGKRSEHTTAG